MVYCMPVYGVLYACIWCIVCLYIYGVTRYRHTTYSVWTKVQTMHRHSDKTQIDRHTESTLTIQPSNYMFDLFNFNFNIWCWYCTGQLYTPPLHLVNVEISCDMWKHCGIHCAWWINERKPSVITPLFISKGDPIYFPGWQQLITAFSFIGQTIELTEITEERKYIIHERILTEDIIFLDEFSCSRSTVLCYYIFITLH